jgi:hypothetical protein
MQVLMYQHFDFTVKCARAGKNYSVHCTFTLNEIAIYLGNIKALSGFGS